MSTLLTSELESLRMRVNRWLKRDQHTARADRACMNDVLNAVEDWYTSNKAAGSQAIDTASAAHGITFTNAEKKQLFKVWMEFKSSKDSIT